MNRIQYFILLFSILLLTSCSTQSSSESSFKRTPAKEVAPVVYENIRYSTGMTDVIATDTLTNDVLWVKEIYSINFDKNLERDVQEIYIDTIYLENNFLIIRNEDGKSFALNLMSTEVEQRN